MFGANFCLILKRVKSVLYVTLPNKEGRRRARMGKSSSQNKGEGALDKAKGKAKEAAGALTGDETKKAEGRSEQTKGTAKDKLGKAKDLLK
jgi:uncharacterized protein YjbJ (UPF0337 family)